MSLVLINITLKSGIISPKKMTLIKAFIVVVNLEFIKMCELIGRFGQGFKPHSYHEIKEYQSLEVEKTRIMLEYFKSE